ncbi:unnamed protein product [Caenorhabditis angaria]|uniref:Uncharacterized protein n=1 Tax=Caenorhabditis angaria TaxID=860376 RepID=A0A9P1IYR6_9PELO|nr:unnamed protein product [Caenorhabditis angaria]
MLGKFLCVLSMITPISGLFFGCCGAPQIQTGCCSQTSWAYAPPRIIGYERIPLYAKVPVAAPPPAYIQPPPPPPQAPNGYLQQPEQIGNYAPQQGQFVNNVNNGQIENGVEVSLDQINSNTASLNSAANYGAQSQSLLSSAPSSGFESSGLIAPAARRLRLHKNFF